MDYMSLPNILISAFGKQTGLLQDKITGGLSQKKVKHWEMPIKIN